MNPKHPSETPGHNAPFSFNRQSQFVVIDDKEQGLRMVRIKWPRFRRPTARRRADIIETLRRAEEMECEFTASGVGQFYF